MIAEVSCLDVIGSLFHAIFLSLLNSEKGEDIPDFFLIAILGKFQKYRGKINKFYLVIV